jgi:predicted metal-dependent hydrolase
MYNIDGTDYTLEVVKKNNKNTYIKVKDDLTILVTTNKRSTNRYVKNLLKDNEKEIKKMVNKKRVQKERNESFYYLGKKYDIIIIPMIDKVSIREDYIYTPDEKALDKWLMKKVEVIFEERYDYIVDNFYEEVPQYKMRIRKMKTRWGVNNKSSKTVTLNYNLIKYDSRCLDYVIDHELSQLVYFDHSKNFWNMVEKYYPGYKEVRKLLR